MSSTNFNLFGFSDNVMERLRISRSESEEERIRLILQAMENSLYGLLMEIQNEDAVIPSWLFSNPVSDPFPTMISNLNDRIEPIPSNRTMGITLRRRTDTVIPNPSDQEPSVNDFSPVSISSERLSPTMNPGGFATAPPPRTNFTVYNWDGSLCQCGLCFRKKSLQFTGTKEQLIYKSKNTECPITLEQIKYNDSYLTCSACKYNFSEEAIVKHLNSKSTNLCPLCRGEWKDYCKYINKDTKIENLKKLEKLGVFERLEAKEIKGVKTTSELMLGEPSKTKHNKKWYYGK